MEQPTTRHDLLPMVKQVSQPTPEEANDNEQIDMLPIVLPDSILVSLRPFSHGVLGDRFSQSTRANAGSVDIVTLIVLLGTISSY